MDEKIKLSDTIVCGNYVIIRRTHDRNSSRLIKAETDKFIYLGKQKIKLNAIFGHRFGSIFELNKKNELSLVESSTINNLSQMVDQRSTDRDNRFIQDDGKSQKLSKDDIESFKSELSSVEIIESLVKNSSTFNEKTSFAQEKYVKKKLQKYSNFVTILRPNVRLLTEMYYSQGPSKINYLRIDSLSQMLSLCNVMSGGKYIVIDSYLGLLTAAVIERIGSDGAVIQVYTDPGPVTTYRQAVSALNLPNETIVHLLYGIQINQAFNLLSDDSDVHSNETSGNNPEIKCEKSDEDYNKDKAMRKELRRLETIKAKEILKDRNMDGLLMLTRNYDPLNILQILLQYVSYSRPFVVFCPNIEPLTNCLIALKKSAVYLRVTETWMRKYQILTDRTRPEMVMSGSSGYLLSGIKVAQVV